MTHFSLKNSWTSLWHKSKRRGAEERRCWWIARESEWKPHWRMRCMSHRIHKTSSKAKSDTVTASEKFLADVAPYGSVKCIRSDNSRVHRKIIFLWTPEDPVKNFQFSLLNKNSIRHESSALYSPHQNSTVEVNWWTLFDVARCMLIESSLPKEFWIYAVMTAAAICNRCFNGRTKQTPFYMLTGKKPF